MGKKKNIALKYFVHYVALNKVKLWSTVLCLRPGSVVDIWTVYVYLYPCLHHHCQYLVVYVWCSVADATVVSQLQWNTANVILLTQPLKIHWIFKDAFDSIHRRWGEIDVGYSSLFLFLHNYPRQSTFTYKMRTWEAYGPPPHSLGTSYSLSISSNTLLFKWKYFSAYIFQ